MSFNPNKRVRSGFNPNRTTAPPNDLGDSPFKTSFGALGNLASTVGPPLLAVGEKLVNTARDVGGLLSKTTAEVRFGEDVNMNRRLKAAGVPERPFYEGLPERPAPYQEAADAVRSDQSMFQNLVSGGIQLAPYLAGPAGAGLFAFDVAKDPKMLAEMAKDVPEAMGTIARTVPMPKTGRPLIIDEKSAAAQQRMHDYPGETVFSALQPLLLGLGARHLTKRRGRGAVAAEKPPAEVGRPFSPELVEQLGQKQVLPKEPPLALPPGERSLELPPGQGFELVNRPRGRVLPPDVSKEAAVMARETEFNQLKRQGKLENRLRLLAEKEAAQEPTPISKAAQITRERRVKHAVEDGKVVPLVLLQKYKGKKWADNAIRAKRSVTLSKLQEVPPLRQITPPAPLLTGKTTGGRVKSPGQAVKPSKSKYVYHGTGEGAFRQIRQEGMIPQKKGGNLYFADKESYAKTYAERKGGVLYGDRILRIKKTTDMIADDRIAVPGDFKTTKSISVENIEVKTKTGWKPIQEFVDAERGILPLVPEAKPPPDVAAAKKPVTPPAKPAEATTRELSKNIKKRGVAGDELLNAIDRIEESRLADKSIEIDPDGILTLYHRTSKKNAQIIEKSGEMITKEAGVFFGSKPSGQISGYGNAVVKVKIPIEKLELNDIFKNEVHFRLPGVKPGEKAKINIVKTSAELKPTAKPKEAAVSTTLPKTAKAVAEGAVFKEPKTIGISNAEVARFRKDFPELAELSRPERISDVKTLSEAKTAGMDRQAISIADDVIRSRRPISRVEEAGIILKQAEIANEIDISTRRIRTLEARGDVKALAIENERRSGFIDQTDRLTRGSEIGGTELARGLGFRRNLVNRESMELAPMLQSAREVAGRKLTDVEVKRYERISEQFKKKEIELKEMEAKHAEFVAKTEREQAKAIVEREIKARTRVVEKKEKNVAERTDAKKRLAELGFEVKTGINPEALFQIGRIAFSYANERAITFAEVVRKVKADIPALAEADIYKAMLTRDPKLQRKARSEASKRRGSLRTQAKLMVDIGNAEKGILKSPKPRPQQLPEILALRKKLAELKKEMYEHPGGSLMDRREAKALETLEHLQAQLTHYYRNVKKKRPIDSQALTDIKNQSRDFRRLMKIQDEMLDLQEQMKTGVFKIKEQPVVRKRPPALERGEIELQRIRQDYRQAKEDAQPWTVKRGGLEIKNFMQTAKATADMSGVMRQGAILSVADPVLAAKSFKKAFGATFDKYKAEQIALTIESHPLRPLQREAKLFIGEIENINILRSEEVFTSRFAERIPGIGRIVKASERNMVTFLNLLRTGTFNQFVRAYPNATMAELTAWADFVNKASGRGKLTPGTGDLLGILFFAPRFAISRVQTPLTLWKYRKLPRVRNAIAKTMAADVGLGITALTLLELSVDAVDVGVDPRGANFGKARIGNTRIDIFAGFQQPFRLLARGVMKLSDEAGVSGQGLTKAEKEVDMQEAAIQFINYKISPVFSTGFALIDKRSVVGEKTTRLETLAKAISPIIVESTIEALRDAGPGPAGLTFGLEFLGMGVNTYQDSDTKVRRMFYRAMVTASPAERIRLRVAFEKTIMKKLDTKGRKQRFKYNKETYNKYVRGDTE